MSDETFQKLDIILDRTVPIVDPDYIIGEQAQVDKFESLLKSLESRNEGITGAVIIGQIGNGKTHFLRYIRGKYASKSDTLIGIYIPDMFVNGPLVEALASIYRSFFDGPGNNTLKDYYKDWLVYKVKIDLKALEGSTNSILRYLSLSHGQAEEELLLDYFSHKDMIPDQTKYLRNRFGLKKKIITNETDFTRLIGDALEFIKTITNKDIVLLIDEVDKVYSSEISKKNLSNVGSRILAAYRTLFDHLNYKRIKGIICVGATPEAWGILSGHAAFERRFVNNNLILKVPKSKKDCMEFISNRARELQITLDGNDLKKIEKLVESVPEEKLKTWADIIKVLKNNDHKEVDTKEDPATEILDVLRNAIAPLTWSEIVLESDILKRAYPKSQPTTILRKLHKEGKIIINETKPKTYEATYIDEEV